MERLYLFIKSFGTVLLTVFVMQSCVKDDLSDCNNRVRLYYDYMPASYAGVKEGINPENVSRINLYVFDENGKFVTEVIDTEPKMSKDYYIEVIGLESGQYRFITWGGVDNQNYVLSESLIVGETSYEDLLLRLNSLQNGQVTTTLPHLFYAKHDNDLVQVNSNTIYRDTLKLKQDTYKINVFLNGVKNASDTHQVIVSDNNGSYRFDNEVAAFQQFEYISNFKKATEEEMETSLTVLRLTDERISIPKLQLRNATTAETLFNENLIELILALRNEGYEINLDYMHEFDIEFTANPDLEIGFEVSVNGWKIHFSNENLES